VTRRAGRTTLEAVAVAAVVLVAAAGCGVPTTDGPQPLPSEVAALAPDVQGDVPSATPTRLTDLAWVKGHRLRLSPRTVLASDTASQASAALAAVIAGPSPAEQARGLSTEVPPDLVATLVLEGKSAIVDLRGPNDRAASGNVTLATAQLALAVLLVPGVDSVTFTVEGTPADVPRADGKVRPGPVTLVDYASLLAGRQKR